MSASSDTTLIVWDLKGNVLKTIDTKQGNNNFASVSPCGRFVACAGFTPDVKVWEVEFGKTGDFKDVVRAFELKVRFSMSQDFVILLWNEYLLARPFFFCRVTLRVFIVSILIKIPLGWSRLPRMERFAFGIPIFVIKWVKMLNFY